MCGRFTLRTTPELLTEVFDLLRAPESWPHQFNISPTQQILAFVASEAGREPTFFRWGLVPAWNKEVKLGPPVINARAETVSTNALFRAPFKRRRCLIPATGFYEWQKLDAKHKQPFRFGLADQRPFAFAGLWDRWQAPDGSLLDSCTIITTTANSIVTPVHNRMPVILQPEDFSLWLRPEASTNEDLLALLRPLPDELLVGCPIRDVKSE